MEEPKGSKHPWRARIIVASVMLILAFIGLIFSDIRKDGAWTYWRSMTIVFAGLCLWLSWYLRRKKRSLSLAKIYHEIMHWAALVLGVFMISIFVSNGLLNRFAASLVVITLLALTTFIAGIYIEMTFMPIGVLLGLFALAFSLIAEYIYTIVLPLVVLIIATVIWVLYRSRHHKSSTDQNV